MREIKIQTGLRLPQKRYDQINKMAEDAGISLNAAILLLLEIGYEAVSLGISAKSHSLAHTEIHSDEEPALPNC